MLEKVNLQLCFYWPQFTHSYRLALTKLLAQILSRDIGFGDIVARRKGHRKTLTHTITTTPVITLTITSTRTLSIELSISLAGHVTKTVFLPITSQGSVFTLRYVGVGGFGISEQKNPYKFG